MRKMRKEELEDRIVDAFGIAFVLAVIMTATACQKHELPSAPDIATGSRHTLCEGFKSVKDKDEAARNAYYNVLNCDQK